LRYPIRADFVPRGLKYDWRRLYVNMPCIAFLSAFSRF